MFSSKTNTKLNAKSRRQHCNDDCLYIRMLSTFLFFLNIINTYFSRKPYFGNLTTFYISFTSYYFPSHAKYTIFFTLFASDNNNKRKQQHILKSVSNVFCSFVCSELIPCKAYFLITITFSVTILIVC